MESGSQNSCPFWDYDDVSQCGRVTYFNFYVPVLVIVFATSFVIINIVLNYYKHDVLHLKNDNIIEEILYNSSADVLVLSEENRPLLSSSNNDTSHNSIEAAASSKHDLMDRHFSLERLKLVKLNGELHGTPSVIKRSHVEKTRVVIEILLVLSQISIHFYLYQHHAGESDFPYSSLAALLATWCMLLGLVSTRLANIDQKLTNINKYAGNIWALSFVSYLTLFVSNILSFRSILIGHIEESAAKNYYASQFYINLLLFGILFFSPIKNSFVIAYKTDEWIIPSPEPQTSIASFISWSWFNGFLWNAYKKSLEAKDIWGLMLEDYSIFVIKRFKAYNNRDNRKDQRFSHILIMFFSNYISLQAFWALCGGILSFVPTLLLMRILEYVDNQATAPANLAWFYVFCMFSARVLVAVCNGQALFFGRRVCIRMRSIIISEIYSKALRRRISNEKPTSKRDDIDPQTKNDYEDIDADEESSSANLGSIINLMAVDSFKVAEICAYLHAFVEASVMVIVALVLLFKLLGFAAIVGSVLIILIMPINYKCATLLGDYQKKSLATTDKRIQKLNETFQAIRIIKFFSWEDNIKNDIQDIRERELNMILMRSLVWAFSSFIWFITPSIVTTFSFTFYIYVQGETLTTPVAFTALSLFTLLKTPLDQLSDMLSFAIQSKVSLDRIQDFLEEPDTEKYEQLTVDSAGNTIAMKNVTVSWNKDNADFKLRNLDIDFKIGKLNIVIGPTGSGKTSLLMALLGEMHLIEGQIIVPSLDPRHELVADLNGMTNSMAYCSQAAWLLNDTVRNNILFNSRYDEARYSAVIEACGLKRDFEILTAGDMTEIGERGMTLSGGQKQRVSLARALYSNSKHILLDDCLSAVDSHTAAWIYDNCITGPLMDNRTCILVSHNIALTLRNAEQVIMLENGRVTQQGNPLTLLHDGALGEDELVKSSILSRHNSSVNLASKSTSALNGLTPLTKTNKENTKKDPTDDERAKTGKLVEEESKSEGSVDMEVYKWYMNVFGGFKVLFLLASLFLIAQAVYISQSWWVRDWVSENSNPVKDFTNNVAVYAKQVAFQVTLTSTNIFRYSEAQNNDIRIEKDKHSNAYYLTIYFLIGLTQAILSAAKTVFSFYAGIDASRKIFNLLLEKALHAKLRFFDSTPIGRIMNRFSKDIEAVDQELTPYVEGVFYCVIELFSTVVLITYITPQFLSIAILVSILYYLIGLLYLTGSRELKRFESITKSPIYQHFSETLVGVTTVRAYGDETRFMQDNIQKIDENNKPFFYMWVANRWLSFRIDIIGSFVIFGAGVFILLNIKNIDSGMAGISLTYAISFTEGALWLVRFYSNLEMNMNSVERLKEYMDIEQEPYNAEAGPVAPSWPQEGKIEVSDLSLRYAPTLPRVINNVSFTVEPKMKVGIVGRTGAGKSTIITALFRFLDADTGNIKIDNIDISSVDLQRLRRSITIIPQDPTLFTGTIKSNLDPYNEHSDAQIFEALKRVNLISDEPANNVYSDRASLGSENVNAFLNLNNDIAEGGGNLSQGQRQLMCLARSLLRSPKIILLDEATASIDYASDAKIQNTIRKEFEQSTILTIAHRLRSVIDYDKILVMDAGEVKEYDHPYSLLLNKNSIFYSMCEHSGELDLLIESSKEAFVEKLNSK